MANKLLQSVTKQYDRLYKPAINVKKQQIANLSGAFQPQADALIQAKKNAFRTFDTNAASRNMFYSGFAPEKQGEYIGETFAPGMAEIAIKEQGQRLGLLDELNKTLIERGENIFGRYDTLAQNNATNKLTKSKMASDKKISAAQIRAMLQKARY